MTPQRRHDDGKIRLTLQNTFVFGCCISACVWCWNNVKEATDYRNDHAETITVARDARDREMNDLKARLAADEAQTTELWKAIHDCGKNER